MQEAQNNHELVSALVDGQLCGDAFAQAVEWVTEAKDARLTWQAYHVVGEVLRSGVAERSDRDAAFMQRLKLGLQQDTPYESNGDAPYFIAVSSVNTGGGGINRTRDVASNDSSYRWKLVAGLASLAIVSMIGWQVGGGWSATQLGGAQLAQQQPVQPFVSRQPVVAGNDLQVMIRDPQLDALLAAHRQFGGTSALQMPAGFIRNATFEGAAR